MNIRRILTLAFIAYINSSISANASESILSISPESCMAKDGWCNTELNISWQLQKAQSVCVKIDNHDEKYCFDKGKNNSQVVKLKVKGPIKIQLVKAKTKEIIATSTMNVFVQEYRKRSRQRHAWSIIQ